MENDNIFLFFHLLLFEFEADLIFNPIEVDAAYILMSMAADFWFFAPGHMFELI